MKKKTLLIGLIGLLAWTGNTYAQDATTPQEHSLTITLAEAQQYAREHNATMLNAELDIQQAEVARWQTLSTMLPQVKASFDYSNMCGYKMDFSGLTIPMNPNGTFGITASVAVTGAQIVGTLLNNIAIEMSDITRNQTERTINSNVKNVYVSILVMEQTVHLLDSNLANMEHMLRTTSEAVKVGAAEQVDADKLAVQVASLRNSINATRRSLAMLYNSLVLQMGADVNTKLVLSTDIKDLLSVDQTAQLLNQPFHIEDNFNYQLLKKSEKVAKQQITLAWMDFTPTISVFYQYSNKTYFGKESGMDMTPPNMVGASISLPLWQTGTRAAKIQNAKLAHQKTQNSNQQAIDGLQVQYNQLSYDLVSALERYQIQTENMDVTKRVFKNISEKYKYGRASSLEVTNASSDLITAQSDYIQAVTSVISAQVALEDLLNTK